jgi:hypothetical protein
LSPLKLTSTLGVVPDVNLTGNATCAVICRAAPQVPFPGEVGAAPVENQPVSIFIPPKAFPTTAPGYIAAHICPAGAEQLYCALAPEETMQAPARQASKIAINFIVPSCVPEMAGRRRKGGTPGSIEINIRLLKWNSFLKESNTLTRRNFPCDLRSRFDGQRICCGSLSKTRRERPPPGRVFAAGADGLRRA